VRWAGVAAANKHTLAVTDGGAVYSWGDNSQGQLGYGTTDSAANGNPRVVEAMKVGIDAATSLGNRTSGRLWQMWRLSLPALGSSRFQLSSLQVCNTHSRCSCRVSASRRLRRQSATRWRAQPRATCGRGATAACHHAGCSWSACATCSGCQAKRCVPCVPYCTRHFEHCFLLVLTYCGFCMLQ
jgi:Regulator of chromosome condensation (RCC1) repeat